MPRFEEADIVMYRASDVYKMVLGIEMGHPTAEYILLNLHTGLIHSDFQPFVDNYYMKVR